MFATVVAPTVVPSAFASEILIAPALMAVVPAKFWLALMPNVPLSALTNPVALVIAFVPVSVNV